MAEMYRGPPLPPDGIYPGVDTSNRPPKLVLKLQRWIEEGMDVISVNWSTTGTSRPFIGFELFFYEETSHAYEPSLWRQFPMEYLYTTLSGDVMFFTSRLTRNRRYYFTCRIIGDLICGPFSDPVRIDT